MNTLASLLSAALTPAGNLAAIVCAIYTGLTYHRSPSPQVGSDVVAGTGALSNGFYIGATLTLTFFIGSTAATVYLSSDPISVRVEDLYLTDEQSGAPDANQQFVSRCRSDEIVVGGTCQVLAGIGHVQNTDLDVATKTFRCVYAGTGKDTALNRSREFKGSAHAVCLKAR